MSGLTLKSILEKEFSSLVEESTCYIRSNILKSYLNENSKIRKTISVIVNTYVKQDSFENWPELLDFLLKNLETEKGSEMSLETINIIIEDSGNLLETKYKKVLINLN